MSQVPEGTVDINNLLLQCTLSCDCTPDDEDDCLVLVSVLDVCEKGVPQCVRCNTPYKWDDRVIIAQMI